MTARWGRTEVGPGDRCRRSATTADCRLVTGDFPLLGFGLPVSGRWATPDTIRRTARRAEEFGYASLWTFQRVLYPAAGALGPPHRLVLDPVVALAHVAKTLTSLDVVSGGRLTAGLGMGWLPQEYAAAGVPYERRGERMDEYLRCLEALWTHDPVEFAGEFYTVPRSHVGPPPVQRPHPPVLLGATAAPALRRAGRLAQGWICSSRQDLATLGSSIETVRDGARQSARDPEAVRIVVRGLVDLVDDDPGGQRRPLQGTREQVLDDLAALGAQGVTEVFLDLNFSPRVSFPDVDARAALEYAERVLDAFGPVNVSR